MNIVFLDAYTMNPGDLSWSEIENLGTINIYEHTTDDQRLQRLQDADIAVVNKCKIDVSLIAACPNLKLICVSATGYNNIDIQAANAHGVLVCNAANYSAPSLAQQVVAMLLSRLNQVSYYNEEVRKGRWTSSRDFCFYDESIEEIGSMKIGIVGYGNLGKSVAKLFQAFGAEILVLNRPGKPIQVEDPAVKVLDRSEFLAAADVVSLHVPLNASTDGLVDYDFISSMKSKAILINTSRGAVINESDLIRAMESNLIRAACLDVMEQEPPSHSALMDLDNVFITPHIAWASKQARERLMRIVYENIRSFQQGEPRSVVS